MSNDHGPDRRTVLRGAGASAAALALAACGGTSSGGAGTGSGAGPTGSGTSPAATTGSGATALATTSEIPVGGGKVFAGQNVVVTQPTAGTFKAFSATCTHQGCTLEGVQSGVIVCPCHGSTYSITDGSVQGGPAPQPLPPVAIKVEGTSIVKG
jgi:Rieske Fe-S protein